MSYAEYDKFSSSSRFDQGHGIDQISPELLTVSDVYRTPFLFLNEHKKKYFHLHEQIHTGHYHS